ncbi:hypothetical protein IWZ00DRAFT_224051 [Phyllosticta capitalensis]
MTYRKKQVDEGRCLSHHHPWSLVTPVFFRIPQGKHTKSSVRATWDIDAAGRRPADDGSPAGGAALRRRASRRLWSESAKHSETRRMMDVQDDRVSDFRGQPKIRGISKLLASKWTYCSDARQHFWRVLLRRFHRPVSAPPSPSHDDYSIAGEWVTATVWTFGRVLFDCLQMQTDAFIRARKRRTLHPLSFPSSPVPGWTCPTTPSMLAPFPAPDRLPCCLLGATRPFRR